MKILVLSDSHKNFIALQKAFDAVPDADTVVHLGDGEAEFALLSSLHPERAMVYVGGNCDWEFHKQTHIMIASGIRIFCCHGHTLNVRRGTELLVSEAHKNDCVIALYGHTHVFFTDVINGVYVMNPGSVSEPRNGNKPTYGVIELGSSGEIKMEIRELE